MASMRVWIAGLLSRVGRAWLRFPPARDAETLYSAGCRRIPSGSGSACGPAEGRHARGRSAFRRRWVEVLRRGEVVPPLRRRPLAIPLPCFPILGPYIWNYMNYSGLQGLFYGVEFIISAPARKAWNLRMR